MSRLLLCVVLVLAVPACGLAQRPPAFIIVTKDVTAYVAPCGYAVTYTITVESNYSLPLYLDYANDTMFGDISAEFPDELPAFGTASAAFDYVLGCDDPNPLVNTVEIAYHEESGESFLDSATATVEILHPMLEAYFECQDPPPPPGDPVSIVFTLMNTGDVALEVSIVAPAGFPTIELGIGEGFEFMAEASCEGDLACLTAQMVAELPPEYGIDYSLDIGVDACCPCTASPVEDESWGAIKALYRN
jgi:hypothetical protein